MLLSPRTLPMLLCLALASPLHASAQQPPANPAPAPKPEPEPEPEPEPDSPTPSEYTSVATATRLPRPLSQQTATVTVLPRRELDLSPALTMDTLLRSVPSVATFRRSSSLSADPSSQGLNLRGVGPSGVSRSLVLLDGMPVNDPFAGSVYFRALPRLGIERVEIVPGGGSALYGSSALSGVVQLISRRSTPRAFEGDVAYGTARTLALAGRAAGGTQRLSGVLEGDWLSSSGYPVVAKPQRGPIDAAAASAHGNLSGRVVVHPNTRLSFSGSGSFFREELSGSTRFTSASAQLASAALRSSYDARTRGRMELLLFGRWARFEQERARIAAGRLSEERAAQQRVPAYDSGGSLSWSSAAPQVGAGNVVSLGLDGRHVVGTSTERLFPPQPSPTSLRERSAGGKQLLLGAFVQDLWRVQEWLELDAALRADWIRNYSGELRSELASGMESVRSYDADDQWSLNPRLGALLEAMPVLRIRGSAYRSFRAATLNELYRPFQVGTVLTAANPYLKPETLYGAELGLEAGPFGALTLRATGFWNLLDDPIVNATLPAPLPDGATRQRRNLGRARIAGVELALSARLGSRVSLLLSYTAADSRVTQAGPVPGVRGKRLPQDPVHRASALLFFDDPALFSASLQLRAVSVQYEDDLNTLRMRGYAVVDFFVARPLVWRLELFAAVENVFDEVYLVGRAGVDTIGQPFSARVGLRIREARAGR